ncbi:MAG TPA: hypothetical protein VEA59_04110 [Patescibacteria group bacterium]|nr:hypothetical protein [Patescibacteria group bacterium]
MSDDNERLVGYRSRLKGYTEYLFCLPYDGKWVHLHYRKPLHALKGTEAYKSEWCPNTKGCPHIPRKHGLRNGSMKKHTLEEKLVRLGLIQPRDIRILELLKAKWLASFWPRI